MFSYFTGAKSSSSSSLAAKDAQTPRVPSYSFAKLQELYERLLKFRESDLAKGDNVIETVRQITEALIWGEQNDTNFFVFFCEKSILSDFIRVLGLQKTPNCIKVQLLQTLSMLVQNIQRESSLHYLFSNNHANQLIMTQLDFDDEEILAYYITLLKSLAMRLNAQTIKFFFVEQSERPFPLYMEAIRFFCHKDQMVRATVRTITLQVYRVEDPVMQRMVHRHAAQSYFCQLAYHLRDLWLRLDTAFAASDLPAAQRENELQQDLLMYLSDVFALEVVELNELLADRLLTCTMFPLFLGDNLAVGSPRRPKSSSTSHLLSTPSPARTPGSSVNDMGVESSSESPSRRISNVCTMFLLRQVFDTFKHRVLLEPLAAVLLRPGMAAAQQPVPRSRDSIAPILSSQLGLDDLGTNELRATFFQGLRGQDDTLFLLSASVLHSCFSNRTAFSQKFLQSANLLPASVEATQEARLAGAAPGEDDSAEPFAKPIKWAASDCNSPTPPIAPWKTNDRVVSLPLGGKSESDECQNYLDVLLSLTKALQRHSSWHLCTFQALIRIVLDLFLDPAVCHNARCRTALMAGTQLAMRTASQQMSQLLEECSVSDDSLLDLFYDEWELHRAPPSNVAQVSGDVRYIMSLGNVFPPAPGGVCTPRSSSSTSTPATVSAGDQDREPETPETGTRVAVRCFLLLRRLLVDVYRYSPKIPHERSDRGLRCTWARVSNEPVPIQIPDEAAAGFYEGMSLEIGAYERVVCGVLTPNGKNTRFLLFHDTWLLLVQPDLASAGWAILKTLWPIRQAQSLVDRSDPRTLRLGLVSHRGGPVPGEASVFTPGTSSSSALLARGPGTLFSAAEDRRSSFFTLTLNFEDVNRCCSVDSHLQRRRQKVRSELMQQLIAFVGQYHASPGLAAGSGSNDVHL